MASRQFTLEYIIKVTGGGAAGAQINQVNNQLKATAPAAKQAATGFQQIEKSSHNAGRGMVQTTGHMKSIAFGMIGLTSAGVEAIGMLGMWADTAKRTDEAQQALNEAISRYGEDSIQATRATQEYTKAQRFQAMTQRNLILSLFDMVPFTLLLVNGIREQIILTKQLRAAQLTNAAAQAAAATAERARVVSQLALVGSTNTLIGSHFRLTPQLLSTAVATGGITTANIAYTTSTVTAGAATSRLGAIMSSTWIKILGPIALIIGGVTAAMIAYKTDAGGFATATDRIGVAIGNAVPQLKGFLTRIKDIAVAFPDVGKMFKAALGLGGDGKASTDEFTKALEELDTKAKELINTMAMADKGDRKDLLSAIGIKGGAAKRFKPILDDIEQITKRITRLGDTLAFTQNLPNISKFFEIPASVMKKISFTFEDVFNDIADMDLIKGTKFEGIFENLATQLENDAKKTDGKNFQKIIAETFMNNDDLLAMFKAIGLPPELISTIETIMEQEAAKIRGRFNLPKVNQTQKDQFLKDIGMDNVVEQLPPLAQTVTVTMMGAATGGGVSTISDIPAFVKDWLTNNLFNAGTWHDAISKYMGAGVVVQGIMTDIWNQFTAKVSQMGGGMVLPAAPALGIAGFVVPFLRMVFNAGTWHTAISTFLSAGAVVQGVMTDIWNQFTGKVNQSGGGFVLPAAPALGVAGFVVPLLRSFFNAGAWHDAINTALNAGQYVQGVMTDLWNQFIAKIKEGGFSLPAPSIGLMGIITEGLNKLLKPNTAEGAITLDLSDNTVEIDPTTLGIDIIEKLDIPIAPEDLNLLLPETLPPLTVPGTPTIPPMSIPTVTVEPDAVNVAWPGAGFQNPLDNPGNKAVGPLGNIFNHGLEALLISVPSVTVAPQQVNLDTSTSVINVSGGDNGMGIFSQAKILELGVAFATLKQAIFVIMQEISTLWNTTMIAMSGIANVTIAAIVSVFGGMVTVIGGYMSSLSSHWASMCSNMNATASSTGSQIASAMGSMVTQSGKHMSALSTHWGNMCSNMEAEAKQAASNITAALKKIPTRINVTVHVGVSGPGVKFMAKGFHGTVNTPTLMMVGEAGPERVDISKTGSAATGLTIDRSMDLSPSLPAGRMPSGQQGPTFVQVFLDGHEFQGKVVRIVRKNESSFR